MLNVEECYALNERLLNVFQTLVEETFVGKILPYLVEINAGLSATMANIGSSDLTKQLAEKDQARDQAFVGFRDYCKAFTSAPNSGQSVAAEKLVTLIRRIGWSLHRQGYTQQSASQDSLIEALAEPEYANAVATIKAGSWVKSLLETNAALETVLHQKNNLIAYDNVPPVNECKRRMVKYLKPLLGYLEVMGELEPETYTDAVTQLSEEIEYIMTIAKARKTRRENLPEVSDAVEEPTE